MTIYMIIYDYIYDYIYNIYDCPPQSKFLTGGPGLRSNMVQRWGPVSRVVCKSQLGPTLHVRTCRVTVPDLKNGWADCIQI